MDPGELEVNRINTKAFIDANSTNLVLIPRTMVSNGEGTSWQDGSPRPAQIVRLIDQSSSRSPLPGTLTGADGIQRQVKYQLLMAHDGIVGLYDHWTDAEDVHWEVADLFPDNNYEVRAQVIRYGE